MAAQISHIIAGEEAFEMAAAPLAALGEAAPYFRLGCQGPDIFYHNRRTMPSGLHYGALAHRRNYGSLVAGAAASLPLDERLPSSPRAAYVLGLATHAAIDRATHPFIIFFAGWVSPSKPESHALRGCHPFLERVLDMGLLERSKGISPADYGLRSRLALRPGTCEDLVEPWVAGLRAAFPRSTATDPLLAQRAANALADAAHFYAVTDPEATAPGGQREGWLLRLDEDEGRHLVSIVYPVSFPSSMDPMNEARAEWFHPSGDGRSSRATYPELVSQGTAAAADAIAQVLRFWRGEIPATGLAAAIGEGGLALSGPEGVNLPPLLSRPLPLAEAMEAEYAARRSHH